MVKLGKMMWNVMVNANCRRARRTGSRSMGASFAQFPEGLRESWVRRKQQCAPARTLEPNQLPPRHGVPCAISALTGFIAPHWRWKTAKNPAPAAYPAAMLVPLGIGAHSARGESHGHESDSARAGAAVQVRQEARQVFRPEEGRHRRAYRDRGRSDHVSHHGLYHFRQP